MSINLDLLKPSASMEVTKLAGELKKQGRKVYPLSAGDTHFPLPQAIQAGFANLPDAFSHYTNAEGIEPLRNLIAQNYKNYTAKEVILVPGLKQGLYYALEAIQQKALCILEPAWLGYEATALMAGYQTKAVNTYDSDWKDKLQQTDFDVIIICSPNNPDGSILDTDTMKLIVNAAEKNNAWIITDFIYDRYVFEGDLSSHNILLNYNKLIVGNGFSKSHAMTGLRAGYLLCKNQEIINRMILIQQNMVTCVPAISQYLLLGMKDADEEIKRNAEYYKQNRNLIAEFFLEWKTCMPAGGFYYFVDLKPYGITDAVKFCSELLKQTGVALVPGGAYGKGFDSYIRLSYSIDNSLLREGLSALKQFINEYH